MVFATSTLTAANTCGCVTITCNLIQFRLNEMRKRLGPLSPVDHAALVRLCNLKKVIQRDDGYGTEAETLISRASAVMLKKRNLAVTGWSHEMYPTKSGRAFVARKSDSH